MKYSGIGCADDVLVSAATARCFSWKLGMQPDRVLLAVMDDRMVAKGLVLHWVTAFFQVPPPWGHGSSGSTHDLKIHLGGMCRGCL